LVAGNAVLTASGLFLIAPVGTAGALVVVALAEKTKKTGTDI